MNQVNVVPVFVEADVLKEYKGKDGLVCYATKAPKYGECWVFARQGEEMQVVPDWHGGAWSAIPSLENIRRQLKKIAEAEERDRLLNKLIAEHETMSRRERLMTWLRFEFDDGYNQFDSEARFADQQYMFIWSDHDDWTCDISFGNQEDVMNEQGGEGTLKIYDLDQPFKADGEPTEVKLVIEKYQLENAE